MNFNLPKQGARKSCHSMVSLLPPVAVVFYGHHLTLGLQFESQGNLQALSSQLTAASLQSTNIAFISVGDMVLSPREKNILIEPCFGL